MKKVVTTSRGNKIDMKFLRDSNKHTAAITNKAKSVVSKTTASSNNIFVPKTTTSRFLNAVLPKRVVFNNTLLDETTSAENTEEDVKPSSETIDKNKNKMTKTKEQ